MTFDSVLHTRRCVIEPFTEAHLSERYVGWLNDPETVRFSEQRHRRHDVESCRAYWRSFANSPHFFAAIVAKDSVLGHIGNINAYLDLNNRVADVGILIGERSVWGQGYGTEAWVAFCRHILLDCRFRKVTAGTLAINQGMRGIMRHAGMREDGRRVRQVLCEGEKVDLIHMALFAEDLPAAQ